MHLNLFTFGGHNLNLLKSYMNTVFKGLVLILLLAINAHAQKAPIKFGDIPMDDLKMTVYEADTSAAAVILADYGESSLVYNQEKGFMLNYERITRIKILKKEGFEWANRYIYVYHEGGEEEKVTSLKGTTYNLENGKIVETKLKNESIFKEKESKNVDVMKVAFTNVKEGSIIEFSYKILSDFIFNFQDWDFQESIPVRYSEYRARIPEYFRYDKYMQGYITLHTAEETAAPSSITITSKERSEGMVVQTEFYSNKIDFQENRYRWVAKDVPAFKEEPYMTTIRDYISRINFELSYTKFPNSPIKNYTTTWENINKLYEESENFGREVTGNGFLKKTVEEVTAGMLSHEEKISAIHNYIRSNFIWDGSTRSFVDGSLRAVVDEKKGNSSELNLLLASMIDKIGGVEVFPTLISTRDHGFLREHTPATNQFNNVICVVRYDGKEVLLDATEKLLPTGFLPERCLNGKGFAISKEGYRWVNLKAPVKSRKTTSIDLTLSVDGEFTGTITQNLSGYYGLKARKSYLTKGESDYVKFFKQENWEIATSEFQNLKELNSSFKANFKVTINDHATIGGNAIYFNPLFKWQMNDNLFKLEKRQYPVDFGSPFDEMVITKINLPQGYTIEEVPQSKVFMLPEDAGKFLFNVNVTAQSINITSSLQINKSLFTQEEYQNLREFYARIIAKHAEQIVLKKI